MEERDYHSLQKGTKLNGRYIIEDVLGEGGFGITYAGRDELLGVKVAVKEYYPQGIVVRNNSVDDVVTVTYAKQKDVFNKGKTKFLEEARVIANLMIRKESLMLQISLRPIIQPILLWNTCMELL